MKAPSRSRSRVPAWVALVAVIGVSAAVWALVSMTRHPTGDPDTETEAAAVARPGGPTAQADLSRLRRAIEVLSQAHADLGGSDRRGAMNDLLSQGHAPTKLTLLLEAAASDPTEPDKDPLWGEMVGGLSAIWQGDAISSGIDLMFTESRPRARDAVVSSFAKLALERTSELTPPQQQRLTEAFIDLHNRLPALQRREVETAARKIAGNDVADLMQGKGMASDEELQVQRDYKRSLEPSPRVAAE